MDFNQLGICIDIMEIRFWIANRQMFSGCHIIVTGYYHFTFLARLSTKSSRWLL